MRLSQGREGGKPKTEKQSGYYLQDAASKSGSEYPNVDRPAGTAKRPESPVRALLFYRPLTHSTVLVLTQIRLYRKRMQAHTQVAMARHAAKFGKQRARTFLRPARGIAHLVWPSMTSAWPYVMPRVTLRTRWSKSLRGCKVWLQYFTRPKCFKF